MPYKPHEKSVLVNRSGASLSLHLPGRNFKIPAGDYIDLDTYPDMKRKVPQINKILMQLEKIGKVLFLSGTNDVKKLVAVTSVKRNKLSNQKKEFDARLDKILNAKEETRIDKIIKILDRLDS